MEALKPIQGSQDKGFWTLLTPSLMGERQRCSQVQHQSKLVA